MNNIIIILAFVAALSAWVCFIHGLLWMQSVPAKFEDTVRKIVTRRALCLLVLACILGIVYNEIA